MRHSAIAIVALVALILDVRVAAQNEILSKAREAATSGRRADALAMLEAHLAESPRDVDARLLYGLVLSWEGRYDEARPELQQVLGQTPEYTDARVALMNVEYWSGRSIEAREQADQILASNPGNITARAVRERLEAAARRWLATTTYTADVFSDDTETWQEMSLALTRRTPVGSFILRGTESLRFDLDDQLVEVEFYPRFRPGTYAFLSVGVSPEAELYPGYRLAFDLYQSIGRGFELSGGARYLDFTSPTQIYVGTLSKYIGNWMLTGKAYLVPGDRNQDSWSYYGGFRRYFGSDGTSYAGATYGHGFSHEEIRNIADLATLDSSMLKGEFDCLFRARLRFFGTTGVSHQQRVNRSPLWQTSISAGFSVKF